MASVKQRGGGFPPLGGWAADTACVAPPTGSATRLPSVPPIGNTLLLQFQSHLPDIAVVRNSFHVRRNETAGDVDEAFLVSLLNADGTDNLVDAYRAMLTSNMEFDGVFVRQVQDPLNPSDPKLEHYRPIGLPGLRTPGSPGSPMEACAIASLHSDTASRRFRGHVFLPPAIDSSQLGGSHWTLTGSYSVAIATFLAELFHTMEPSGGAHYDGAWNDVDLVVYSRKARSLDADQFYAQVQSASNNRKVHWLRSRSPEI